MSPAKAKPAGSARERILNTASQLFYRNGIRGTGIDRIIAESGVAKMSFYRHFPSKTDLIAEYLNVRHDRWMAWFTSEVEQRIEKPGKGLEVIADVLSEWFSQPDFHGCAFINTFAESGESGEREQSIAAEHKKQLTEYLEGVTKRLNLPQPKQLAQLAMIIIEGSIIRAQITGSKNTIPYCRKLLRNLVPSTASQDQER